MTAKFIQENKVKLSHLTGIIFSYTLHKLPCFFIVPVKIKSDGAEFNTGHAIAEYSEYSNNQQLLSNLNFIMYN